MTTAVSTPTTPTAPPDWPQQAIFGLLEEVGNTALLADWATICPNLDMLPNDQRIGVLAMAVELANRCRKADEYWHFAGDKLRALLVDAVHTANTALITHDLHFGPGKILSGSITVSTSDAEHHVRITDRQNGSCDCVQFRVGSKQCACVPAALIYLASVHQSDPRKGVRMTITVPQELREVPNGEFVLREIWDLFSTSLDHDYYADFIDGWLQLSNTRRQGLLAVIAEFGGDPDWAYPIFLVGRRGQPSYVYRWGGLTNKYDVTCGVVTCVITLPDGTTTLPVSPTDMHCTCGDMVCEHRVLMLMPRRKLPA